MTVGDYITLGLLVLASGACAFIAGFAQAASECLGDGGWGPGQIISLATSLAFAAGALVYCGFRF